MTALDLEAVQKVPDEGTDWGKAIEDYNALIAEVRKLREIVLADHKPYVNSPRCVRCSDLTFEDETIDDAWPCPPAQAAGAT